MKSIAELGDLRGKRVLVRSDLNVPLEADASGSPAITDDGRIRASVPTIAALSEAGARVIVCAHLGRPKGTPEEKYSLAPVAARLGELLGRDVTFATGYHFRPEGDAPGCRTFGAVWWASAEFLVTG